MNWSLYISLTTLLISASAQSCLKDESIALLKFKENFLYDESASIGCEPPNFRMVSWKLGIDCCSWNGVTCDNVTGQVIGLDLSCSGLKGNFTSNSSLFHLSHLQRLNLAFNDFNRSAIPHRLGSLSNLFYLNLSTTWFSGPVPSQISHFSKLVSLDLSLNEHLSLDTQSFTTIVQNLTQVTEIFLDYVNMSSVDLDYSLANLSSSLTTLTLIDCGLKGKFPETVFHLLNLQFLNLASNEDLYGRLPTANWSSPLELLRLSSTSFSGGLPDSIGNLNSLIVLELDNCNFTGNVSASVGRLEQLVRLDISNNNWTGQMPDVFGNLSNLKHLSCSNSNFSGTLPSSIFNCTQLDWLDMSQNQFQGNIPNQVCELSSLVNMDLSYNLLSGVLPSCLCSLPSLKSLKLDFNQLSGQLGEFQSKSLEEITLENNKIYGSIPLSVSELVNLTNLHLPSNNLSGVVDLNMFSKLKKLWGLDLSNNHLSVIISNSSSNSTWPPFYRLALSSCNISEFPEFLRTQNQLGYLSFPHNKIRGEIPKWLFDLHYLEYVDLSHNFLTKVNELPSNNLLQFLDLSFNWLQQTLPIPPPSMYILLISNNKLTGEISTLFCNVTTFQIIDLSNNSLHGRIPQCLGNFNAGLSVLNLGMNNFVGTIPGTFPEGNKLRNLNLNGNQLEGAIPRSLVNCKMLEVLDLGNNKINDSFPQWLEALPKLQVLVLRSNKFHGFIGDPVERSFSSLRIIDISYNEFTGLLPTKYIANLQAMMMRVDEVKSKVKYMGEIYYQDSVRLTLKGVDAPILRILTIFTTIDLSSNRFYGKIPEVVGNLSSLIVLNLSHNSLTGTIPTLMGNLMQLESLDLSSNKLDGKIPEKLTSMTFLAVLNLSYNKLAGPIPHGKQFDTFENDSYIGNLGLCGIPLSVKCRALQSPPSVIFQETEDSESIFFDWKFAVMGYGCGVVFGLSMGYIVFSIGKPLWLVRMVEKTQMKMLRRKSFIFFFK